MLSKLTKHWPAALTVLAAVAGFLKPSMDAYLGKHPGDFAIATLWALVTFYMKAPTQGASK